MSEKDPLRSSPRLFNHLIDVEYGDILLVRNTSKKWLKKLPFVKCKEFSGIGILMSGNTVITMNRFSQEEVRLFSGEDYVIMRYANHLSEEDKKRLHNCQIAYMRESRAKKKVSIAQKVINTIKSGLFSTRNKETSLLINEIYLRAGFDTEADEALTGNLEAYDKSPKLIKVFDSREA